MSELHLVVRTHEIRCSLSCLKSTDRHSSDFLLGFLKVIIMTIVCLAPVIDC